VATSDIYDPLTADRQVRIVEVSCPMHPVLRVRFDDGAMRDVDFTDLLAKRGPFTPLTFREAFRDVAVIDDGRALQWINGVDFCADALRLKADEQDATGSAAAE